MHKVFPKPTMFAAWRDWAAKLVSALEEETEEECPCLPPYPVSRLPKATMSGLLIFVPDEAGGPVPAFSDGTNWRRVTDRAIVS